MKEKTQKESDLERIRQYAEEQDKKGGFIYCFRGEVSLDATGYVNDQLEGTWYSEDINTTMRFLQERENSTGKKGKIYSVVVPVSLLKTGRDEIDAARHIINIINNQILQSRSEVSRPVLERLRKSQDSGSTIAAGKDKYLSQFGI
ncbi:MAG: hypothetical protein OEX81_03985 [Candidatus Pacebacteria bacterium]|nr:hypothetical protein [Candidatus Paceibacterota bacterium]